MIVSSVSIRKVVERITMSGGTANLCSLDLSKAFDKVNHHALYIALMKRHLPLEILELLENWLSNNFSCVKWHGIFSQFLECHLVFDKVPFFRHHFSQFT